MIKQLLLGISLLLLAACTTIETPSTPSTPVQSAQSLKSWTIKGTIIITSEEESTHARFNWQQNGQNYTIDFFGPLGTYHHALFGSPNKVTLLDQQNHLVTASTPEALLEKTVGWNLPVRNLYYWIRGLPHPAPGWTIEYPEFTSFEHYKVPKIILLTYPGLSIKIKIDEWNLN